MTCLSAYEMFGFGGFDFSSASLTLHIGLSALALGILKAASSIGAIRSKLRIRLMVVVKLSPFFSSDFSGIVSCRLLMLIMASTSE